MVQNVQNTNSAKGQSGTFIGLLRKASPSRKQAKERCRNGRERIWAAPVVEIKAITKAERVLIRSVFKVRPPRRSEPAMKLRLDEGFGEPEFPVRRASPELGLSQATAAAATNYGPSFRGSLQERMRCGLGQSTLRFGSPQVRSAERAAVLVLRVLRVSAVPRVGGRAARYESRNRLERS